jgi:hypothetical protein
MDTLKRTALDQQPDDHLRVADPAAPYLDDPRVGDALDALGLRILADTGAPASARSARRVRMPAAAGLAALAGGVAVAAQFTTHTGFFGWDGADHSEWLRPDAPDFLPYARQLTAHTTFAPGDSAENYWWRFQLKNDDGTYTQFSTTGVKSEIADAASCSWQRVWLTAHNAGDATTMNDASQHIHAAAASDDLRSNNNAKYTEHLIDSADAGDIGPLQTSLKMACPQPKPQAAP